MKGKRAKVSEKFERWMIGHLSTGAAYLEGRWLSEKFAIGDRVRVTVELLERKRKP